MISTTKELCPRRGQCVNQWLRFWVTGSLMEGCTGTGGLLWLAQMVNNLPAMQKTWVRPLGWEDSLEKGMTTHSSILAWKIPWTEVLGGLLSMGSQRVGHDWVTNSNYLTGKGWIRGASTSAGEQEEPSPADDWSLKAFLFTCFPMFWKVLETLDLGSVLVC